MTQRAKVCRGYRCRDAPALLFSINWAGHWRGLAATAAIDLADVFDHTDLHRDNFKLLADLFTDGMLTAPASAGQFVLGQFVDDFDAR